MSIVHIVPSAVFANTYHGSYKDTITRVRYLEASDRPYQQILLDSDDPDYVLANVKGAAETSFLVEYSIFPRVVRALRRQFPDAFLAVRSHNVEPLQHFDNHGWWPQKGPLWLGYGIGRLFQSDLVIKRYASVIWSISDWESKIYWSKLPGGAAVAWLPYSCPEHLLPRTLTPIDQRNRIACMPTSQKNRKSWDLVTRFISFAELMKKQVGDRYEFTITGCLSEWGLPPSPAVTYTGMIDDLGAFLQTVRVVANLSDLGYGFKTTIGDAIANGCQVLVGRKLGQRCPRSLDNGLIFLDSLSKAEITKAVQQIEVRSSVPELNLRCHDRSMSMLDAAFLQPRSAPAVYQPAS